MCGIAGFAGNGSRADIERMTSALEHRGPDGVGFFHDEEARVHLGHRRLSILDAELGQQPMWNEDGQIGVVYNGEIYNHRELRAELEGLGHRFRSHHSDTEVLVHGFEEWGEDLPLKLNGMFAFAVLDRRRGSLFLARDRFGEKPLYTAIGADFFAFASELSALAEHPGVSRSFDQRALRKLFAYGYVPSPHALLEGTAKLPGGSWLRWDWAAGRATTGRYWQFELEPDEALGDADEPQLVDECAALITQAARRRMMSDVPLGLFLSGGLDSSLVLASLAESVPAADLATFTIGFDEPSYDESAHAQVVSEHVGSRHHLRMLDLATARDAIPSVLGRLDEPLGDASLLPTHLVSAYARENVTVALSGDGGDELFAGYDPFLALSPARLYERAVPRPVHGAIRRLVDLLPIGRGNMSLDFRLRRTLMGLGHPEHARLPIWMASLDPKDLVDFLQEPVDVEDVYDESIALWHRDERLSATDRALEFFTRFYLQDDILTKVDRAAMMSSLETRAVFLDNDLVDFCRRLPSRFKLRGRERKYLLRRVAERVLPITIVDRPKKGFGIPVSQWLRTVPTEPPMAPVSGLSTEWASRAFDTHRAGTADHRMFLWTWLALQAAAERYESATSSPRT